MPQRQWTFDDLAGDREYRVNEAILYKMKRHYDREIRSARSAEEVVVVMEELEELVEGVHDYFLDAVAYASSIIS